MKVLIVDDDPIVRRFTAIVLETLAQVRTVEAGDLLEALTCAAAEQPDLVLLDGDLPILDGPHALAHLRADPETAHLPVVLLCNGDGARLAALGADGVVDKSLSPVSLAEAVLAALARLRTRLMRRPA